MEQVSGNLTLKRHCNYIVGLFSSADDYRSARAAPSGLSVIKIVKAFPQYTCYLLGLDPKTLPEQIKEPNS
jgi:hypothetical protein